MGFAADAIWQQQWVYPNLHLGFSNATESDGFRAGSAPLSTPSTATESSSSSQTTGTSRPRTPDNGHKSNGEDPVLVDPAVISSASDTENTSENKTDVPPALPPVYRLSVWPNFEQHGILAVDDEDDEDDRRGSSSNNIDDGNDKGNDSDEFDTVAFDRLSEIEVAIAFSDQLDSFLNAERSSVGHLSDSITSSSNTSGSSQVWSPRNLPPAAGSVTATHLDRAQETETTKTSNMAGSAYMAVSSRPLTAQEYQRYRSQRLGGESRNLPPTTATFEGRCISEGTYQRVSPAQSENRTVSAQSVTTRTTKPAAISRDKKGHRTPSISSPGVTTKEEFESLPPAIQRKYFSTLERLRLTQHPNITLDSSQASNNFYDFSSAPLRLRRARRARGGSDYTTALPPLAPRFRTLSVDSPSQHLSVESQTTSPVEKVKADRNLLSVIVDTVDAASLETETPSAPAATAHTEEQVDTEESHNPNSPGSPEPLSAQSHPRIKEKSPPTDMMAGHTGMVPDSFYESFRCLDETSNLDLQLRLDNYPTSNTRPSSPPTKQRNPSFRRHLSISKVHLGLSSPPSSSRPGTKDTSGTSTTSPPPSVASFGMPMSPTHGRRRSRALSLRTPGPSIVENPSGPVTSGIDGTAAAHYQDPEARLKLRVYLASPQKFDEAVEFGFPSTELRPGRRGPEVHPLRKQQSCFVLSDDSDKVHTFLSDDKSSVYSDDVSMAEPDSPKTPEPLEKPPATRPYRAASDAGLVAKMASDYNQAAASAREMTLRMTLTRPDLRAGEDQIYGWQQKHVASGRKSQSSALREELSPTVVYIREGNSKDSIERQFAVFDQWAPPERGVVKRFWNRVRRQ